MGGGGGGPYEAKDLKKLVEQAKERLKGSDGASRRNVFISFAHEDLDEVNLLRGQGKNANAALEFNDWSVSEPYNSERAAYIKQKISERIAQSSVTVVYLSKSSVASPWVKWEVGESIRQGKHVLVVHKGKSPMTPLPKWMSQPKLRVLAWSDLADTIEGLP
jgi:glycerophosphoryl diester phosphodiesterase